ncbi:EAL domain-containing response regulator [Pseudomonas chlororaphis]|uniref:EAL domain-containing response regulator n=1 Tax=Pseudomonas chlororaphis TaxID=587753 RepID=UPI001F2ED2D3|nr:EAL domain-containing response regulator [Pseudomonas chlororaphis]
MELPEFSPQVIGRVTGEMCSPSVLVLEEQSFQRGALVTALQHLGVDDILQADDSERALTQIYRAGGVDIVLCDLSDTTVNCLDFLTQVAENGMAHAVVLCSELKPELRRAVEQMTCLSGLQMLGVMSKPTQLYRLQEILSRYSRRRPAPDVESAPHSRLPSEEDVRRGLAQGEFRAWFQPKFDLKTSAVAGAEALVRWQHPVRGLLLPRDFLAAVLAYDLIDEMLKQLLEQGMTLLNALRRSGLGLELAFNLHASQLARNDLIEHIEQLLKRHGFPGWTLLFEVAENGLLDVPRTTRENLQRLRMMGCGLSIDDFGMGFSSLTLLCQLPFNQLKLDGQLVRSIEDPRTHAMVTSTVALARALNMSLVIEGVGSHVIRDGLVAMGCSFGQGFYLARPMEAQRFLRWLQESDSPT